MAEELKRCGWVTDDTLYQYYHDHVWGRPVRDSKKLFAMLCLEGQQAGLSWITVLKKQRAYEAAFYQFDPHKIATMTDSDIERLVLDPSIIRSRNKITSIINNAKAFLALEETERFADFVWQFTDHKTIQAAWSNYREAPTCTKESKAMAKALKKRGFSYVGDTICYAYMQAVGMVNDHAIDCHCYKEIRSLSAG